LSPREKVRARIYGWAIRARERSEGLRGKHRKVSLARLVTDKILNHPERSEGMRKDALPGRVYNQHRGGNDPSKQIGLLIWSVTYLFSFPGVRHVPPM
jgi:hypothetical protein